MHNEECSGLVVELRDGRFEPLPRLVSPKTWECMITVCKYKAAALCSSAYQVWYTQVQLYFCNSIVSNSMWQ